MPMLGHIRKMTFGPREAWVFPTLPKHIKRPGLLSMSLGVFGNRAIACMCLGLDWVSLTIVAFIRSALKCFRCL